MAMTPGVAAAGGMPRLFQPFRPERLAEASESEVKPETFGVASQIAARLGAAVCSAALLLGSVPPVAHAVTENQLVFLEAWRAVDRAYVDKTFNGNNWFKVDMPSRPAAYDAIRDVLRLLDDPFTRFLDPEQFRALSSGTKGAVTGVGLEVGYDANEGADSRLVVVAPSDGGPADRAGIRPKDVILSIDGKDTKSLTLYQAAELLQGAEGSSVELSVQHGERGPLQTVTLQRAVIKLNPVSYGMCGPVSASVGGAADKLGYIKVSTFNKNTFEATQQALLKLKEQGAERYVLDVRNNGGGLFPAGVQVAKLFIRAGDIVLIADSQGIRDSYSADLTAIEDKKPMAVLVNKGTASAAEVLTGALQDNGRATVVGEKTFGKGIIQTVVPLSDGSAVAVTAAAYQTPNEVSINKIGITPDLPLPDDVPTNPEAFCKLVESSAAPRLYR
eukprot:jgi/Tetstr1/448839/TSEL_036065.t1